MEQHGEMETFANAFFTYLDRSAEDGLLKWLSFASLVALKNRLMKIPLEKNRCRAWTKADILLTDAFMHVVQDSKQAGCSQTVWVGPMMPEKYFSFFSGQLDKLIKNEPLDSVFKNYNQH